jgi:hypothetical protein
MANFNVPLPFDLNEILRSNSKVTLNPDTPIAPSGCVNISWQVDEFGNISAYTTTLPLRQVEVVRTGPYTITDDDVSADFALIPVTWPHPFSDLNYAVIFSCIHGNDSPVFDVAAADISLSSITLDGFVGGIYINPSSGSDLIGNTIQISAMGIHN